MTFSTTIALALSHFHHNVSFLGCSVDFLNYRHHLDATAALLTPSPNCSNCPRRLLFYPDYPDSILGIPRLRQISRNFPPKHLGFLKRAPKCQILAGWWLQFS